MLRIIAGQFKGRKLLPPPKGSSTRPITGIVRKSLFDILAGRLADAVVADLYCGTGTLGLEALSRGARLVYFAEQDRAVISRLKRNIEAVGAAARSVIWPGALEAALAARLSAIESPIDIVFVDPPYADVRNWSWEKAAADIFAPLAGAMSDDGILALRSDDRAVIPPCLGGLVKARVKQYGNMVVSLFVRASGGHQHG
jgi:16S rRNA (guanine(966)-N(2))-methyltransferase RsmD